MYNKCFTWFLRYYSKQFKKIDINKTNFFELTKSLQNKKLLNTTRKLLNLLFKSVEMNSINPRILLSCYTIINFPNIVLSDLQKDEYVYNSAKRTIELFTLFLDGVIPKLSLVNQLVKYNKDFNNWKYEDMFRVIKPFIDSYYQLDETLSFIENDNKSNNDGLDIWKEEIKKQQNSIKNQIYKIGGKIALDTLNNYEPPQVIVEKKIERKIQETLRKAFWDLFEENVKKGDFTQIKSMLVDLKKMITELVPNNTTILKELNDNIDEDYIDQLIRHDVFQPVQCYKLMLYVKELISKFQAPEDDKDTTEWWNKLQYYFSNSGTYADILPLFFKIAFLKLEKIKIVVEHIKSNLNKTKVN